MPLAYARTVNRFSEKGVIDITGFVRLLLAAWHMIMNVSRTPLPPGKTPPLAPVSSLAVPDNRESFFTCIQMCVHVALFRLKARDWEDEKR